jgi:hypothetical protein
LLETERRAALRQHEDELAAEAQRLDDVAKEQRLRQVESMEQAYQTQLQASQSSCLIASVQFSLQKSGFTEKQLQFNNWHRHRTSARSKYQSRCCAQHQLALSFTGWS